MDQYATSTPQEYRTPNPRSFSFFGLDNQMPQIERNMKKVEIRGGEPEVTVVDGAVYTPAGQFQRERGQLARRLSESLPETENPTRELDEEVIYLGWLFNHYGHFLMQSLARVWFLNRVDPSVKVIFHHSTRGRWKPTGWALRMLEEFGIPADRILTLDEPTRLRRMIVPEPLFEPRSVADDHAVRVHEAMAQPYRELAARIVGNAKPSAQPVYLSRRLLPSSQRQIVGEGELEDILCQNGFRIAHLQTMAFEDQVRLINGHSQIFSNAGSAAQNVLFALHAPQLHLLTSGHKFSPDYFMHHTLVGSPTTFINCLGTGGRPVLKSARKQTPHLVSLPTVSDYLDQHGLLTKPVPELSAQRAQELHDEYDETWHYGRIQVELANRGELPRDIEDEALEIAASSWPVSWALARYYIKADTARADVIARQFAVLAEAERNPERLARYQSEIMETVPTVTRHCATETRGLVSEVVAKRFLTGAAPVANA